jgi:hypothetical protein
MIMAKKNISGRVLFKEIAILSYIRSVINYVPKITPDMGKCKLTSSIDFFAGRLTH